MPLNATLMSPELTPKSSRLLDWYDVLSFCIALVGIVGNSCVIYLVRTRSSLKETCNSFILSLAVADLLIVLVIQPSRFACGLLTTICDIQLHRIFSELFVYWSVYNLCGMTVERYVSIVFPMRHKTLMSKERVVALIAFCWLIPLINFALHFPWFYSESMETKAFWLRTFTAIETCTMVGIPSIILVALYIRIFFVAQRHRKITANQIGIVNYNKHLTNSVKERLQRETIAATERYDSAPVVAEGRSEMSKNKYEKHHPDPDAHEFMSNETSRPIDGINSALASTEACEHCSRYTEKYNYSKECIQTSTSLDNTADDKDIVELSIVEGIVINERNLKQETDVEIPAKKRSEKEKPGFLRMLSGYSMLYMYHTQSSFNNSKQSIKKRLLDRSLNSKRRRSGASVIGCVIGVFLACWGVSLYSSICYYYAKCPVSPTTKRMSWVLLLLNSAVNPVVYALLKSDMRAEFVRLVRQWKTQLGTWTRSIKIIPMLSTQQKKESVCPTK